MLILILSSCLIVQVLPVSNIALQVLLSDKDLRFKRLRFFNKIVLRKWAGDWNMLKAIK